MPIPAPVDEFVGRAHDVTAVRDALCERCSVIIISANGSQGAGAAQLAYAATQIIGEDYFKRKVEVDMRGDDDEALSAEDAIREVILSLVPDHYVPEDSLDLANAYDDALDDIPTLIFVRNVGAQVDLEKLRPHDPSVLLCTSAGDVQLHGAMEMLLGPLTEDEAVELAARTLVSPRPDMLISRPVSPDSDSYGMLSQLAGVCKAGPFALRLAVGRLNTDGRLRVNSYLDALARAVETGRAAGLSAIEVVLEESANALRLDAPELAKAWSKIAVFPAPFDRDALLAATGIDEPKIALLTARGFMLDDPASGLMRLHGLVESAAADLLEDADLDSSAGPYIDHYLAVFEQIAETYAKGGSSREDALRQLHTSWPHIEFAQGWADSRGLNSQTLAFGLAGKDLVEFRLRPKDRSTWFESAVNAAIALGDRANEGRLRGILGIALGSWDDYQPALEQCRQHLAIAQEVGDRPSEAQSLQNLAQLEAFSQRMESSIDYNEQALDILRELGDRAGEAHVQGELARSLLDLGRHKEGITHLQAVLAIAKELEDTDLIRVTLGNLGFAHQDDGELEPAIECYKQLVDIERKKKSRAGEAAALWNLAQARLMTDDEDQAIVDAEEAVRIYEEIEFSGIVPIREQLAEWKGDEWDDD